MCLPLVTCGGDDTSADTSVEETNGADNQPALDAFDTVANAMLEAKDLLEGSLFLHYFTRQELITLCRGGCGNPLPPLANL